MEVTPIGSIVSPFKEAEHAPLQGANTEETSIIVLDEAVPREIMDAKKVLVLYWMHLANREELYSAPLEKGVFALRGPGRPNPIGVTVVDVVEIMENKIVVKHLDALDGTPVLSLSPWTR